MFRLAFYIYSLLLRLALYLAISGQIVTALPDMEKKAFKSVSVGLMSLGKLNRSLHKRALSKSQINTDN